MSEILISDTTLRDGEQMPGVIFNKSQKIDLAKKISKFGVDIIELMPAISKYETEVAEYLVGIGMNDKLTASTLSRREHIDLAESIGMSNVTLFTSISDIHLGKKLKISRQQNLENSIRHVEYARERGLRVSFAGEDSSRADLGYLVEFINSLEGKIDYFLSCDTLGILTPKQTYEFIGKLKQETNCKIGLHIHNDFGQATANTLAGIEAGADLFSGTFTGIGERAGNAPIEEVVMALRYQYGRELPLNYRLLGELCGLVEQYSGAKLQRHKPISGENAFSHESGTHVDGIIKYPRNYENFDPRIIGEKRRILFGKHSGTSGLKYLFGDKFTKDEYVKMLEQVKSNSMSQGTVFSEEEIVEMFQIMVEREI
ncbi:MAG: homoaconitate hydratase [Nanoarchaeota archaeon]|nr:homoaconitate hydratase [Nanoarchaeota archaeon]